MADKDHDTVLNIVEQIVQPGNTNDKVMDLYTTWAQTYEEDLAVIDYSPPKVPAKELAALYSENKDIYILDAAAGTGLGGQELKNHGFHKIDALDASSEMLERAKKKNVYQRLICDFMGPNRLDIMDDTYDAVVTTGSFCSGHVKGDCFEEMIRIIKPGGVFVLAMGERYLHMTPEFANLEEEMQDLETVGKWKRTTRRILPIPEYATTYEGIIFVFRIL